MGLLDSQAWKAQWIGYDAAYQLPESAEADNKLLSLAGLPWIRIPVHKGVADTHAAFFRKIVTLETGAKVKRAVIALYADNFAAVSVNGQAVGKAMRWEKTSRLDATGAIHGGDNVIAIAVTNSDSLPAAAEGKIAIQYEGGREEIIVLDGAWKGSQVSGDGWEKAGFDDRDWVAPVPNKSSPWGTPALNELAGFPRLFYGRSLRPKRRSAGQWFMSPRWDSTNCV